MAIPTISDIAGITAPPEMKFTNSGKAILNIRLAFNDSKYDEQSQKWINSKTFYVDGQAWEQTAERLVEQLAQGDQIYVTGRIETQSWEKDGEKKSKPVLNIQTARKLEKANRGPAASGGNGAAAGNWGGNQATTGNNSPGQWAAAPGSGGTPAGSGWGNGPDSEPPF